jgi:hypothetical protein
VRSYWKKMWDDSCPSMLASADVLYSDQPTFKLDDLPEVMPYQDVICEPVRRKALPFCSSSERCSVDGVAYRIKGQGSLWYVAKEKGHHCRRCGHAVVYSYSFLASHPVEVASEEEA